MTPYYADDQVTLYLGDCRKIAPSLDLHADAIVTDPPYGETSLRWDVWPEGWVDLAATITNSLWCFGSMRMFLDHRDDFAAWRMSQDVIWEKHNGATFHADRFARVHETITHWYLGPWGEIHHEVPKTLDAVRRTVHRKGRPSHTGNIGESSFTSEDGGPRLARSVIYSRSMHGRAIHPTEKPTGVIEQLLMYSVPPAGHVVDLFSGSAAVAAAAKGLGMRATVFEEREDYAEESAKRLAQDSLFGAAL